MGAIVIVLFVLGYFFDAVYFVAKVAAFLSLFAVLADVYLLFPNKNQTILLTRELPGKLSNGDINYIDIFIRNRYLLPLDVILIDELPAQVQKRDFEIRLRLHPGEEKQLKYPIQPFERGEFIFGCTNVFITSVLKLIKRRYRFGEKETVIPVYPSFLKMRQYELLAISNRLNEVGIKRVRKRGTHTEFDQIKDYVKGDSYRTLNWKATAKKNRLMVNVYQEERSQQVYNIIDTGRSMLMPFGGMSLVDYAINASLVFSNIALQKHDKAGIISFDKKINTYLAAEKKKHTIPALLEMLYKLSVSNFEADFSRLGVFVKRNITHRSLLIIYTNFQSPVSVENQIGYLKHLAKSHLVLVVVFENTEINSLLRSESKSIEEIYVKTIAEKYIYDKKRIMHEFKKHGILSIYTKPQDLSAGLINKYLEIKQTGIF